jgi:hypothetical protein
MNISEKTTTALLLDNEVVNTLIVNILKDDIIMHRIEDVMFRFHNAFHPEKREGVDSEWTWGFSGYNTALCLLQVDDEEDLCNILCEINFRMKNNSIENANILAEKIYFRWLVEIKNYYTKRMFAH